MKVYIDWAKSRTVGILKRYLQGHSVVSNVRDADAAIVDTVARACKHPGTPCILAATEATCVAAAAAVREKQLHSWFRIDHSRTAEQELLTALEGVEEK